MESLEKKIKELKLSQESKKAENEKRTADMNCTALLEKKLSENLMLQEKLNLVMQAKERVSAMGDLCESRDMWEVKKPL